MKVKESETLKFEDLDLEQVRVLAEYGHTDDFMADFFKVPATTWHSWKKSHPDFFKRLKGWKAVADDRVERALYERALGYEWEEDAVVWDKYAKERVMVRLEKRLPPDPSSCFFWLKNRRKDQWREKVEVEQSGKVQHDHNVKVDSYELEERVKLIAEMAAENRVNQIDFGKELQNALQ